MTNTSSWSTVSPTVRRRTRAYVLRRDGQHCQIHGPGCTSIATTVDHITAREIGGDGVANLRAACATCNQKRGNPRLHDPQLRTKRQW